MKLLTQAIQATRQDSADSVTNPPPGLVVWRCGSHCVARRCGCDGSLAGRRVLSRRPSRIAAELAVDLPYPRQRGSERFVELRHLVLKQLGLHVDW